MIKYTNNVNVIQQYQCVGIINFPLVCEDIMIALELKYYIAFQIFIFAFQSCHRISSTFYEILSTYPLHIKYKSLKSYQDQKAACPLNYILSIHLHISYSKSIPVLFKPTSKCNEVEKTMVFLILSTSTRGIEHISFFTYSIILSEETFTFQTQALSNLSAF